MRPGQMRRETQCLDYSLAAKRSFGQCQPFEIHRIPVEFSGMTIRYTCTGCDSVLKIRDEKAGTKGKCPKCKHEFLIPDSDGQENEGTEGLNRAPDTTNESVDMPIDLTPEVPDSAEFDPSDVLGTTPSSTRSAATSAASASQDRKPSIAELMKDFEATKKKEKKSTPEISRPVAATAAAAAAHTSGSAADAISRSYQQKRDSAAAPSVRPQDAKAAEERAMLVDFLKTRAIPAAALLFVAGYAYFWWLNYEPYTGLPLYSVVGEVLQNGTPAEGFHVEFGPISTGPNDLRSIASSITDKEGKFELVYIPPHKGAPAGDYDVSLLNRDGNPVMPSEGPLKFTVKEDGPNEFKIAL